MKEEMNLNDVNDSLHQESEEFDTPSAESDENGIEESASSEECAEAETPVKIDYAALAESDLSELKREFGELAGVGSIAELDNPIRYGALRDLGLTPAEAYLATRKREKTDNRAHLRATRSVARGAAPLMSEAEMSMARDVLGNVTDAEIRRLYKRVTK